MRTVPDLFYDYLRPGDSFIDLGAKNGVASALPAAVLVGSQGKVVAIEPDPEPYQRLCHNVAFAGHRNIRCLNVPPPFYRVDQLCSSLNLKNVTLIRVDAPDSELAIISGMGEVLHRPDKPSLIFQLGRGGASEDLAVRLQDLLEFSDYDVRQFDAIIVARAPKMRLLDRLHTPPQRKSFWPWRGKTARPAHDHA
jgi:hypothetical protein